MNIKQLDGMSAYTQANNQQGSSGLDGGDTIGKKTAFSDLISDSIGDVSAATSHVEVTAAKSLVNEADLVDVVTAVSNAEMVVDTVVTVRDKVIAAYNDIIKMPI